jgi:hypothetical protein
MSLSLAGTVVATLTGLDNDVIDSVRLGAMDIGSGSTGTLYFDDYDSHRYTEIGLAADPGTEEATPTGIANWINKSYSYDSATHKHAVTSVTARILRP